VLTFANAAARLGVSASTVRRLCDRGELAYVRPSPRCLRIEDAELERYLAQLRAAAQRTPAAGPELGAFQKAELAYLAAARAGGTKRRAA